MTNLVPDAEDIFDRAFCIVCGSGAKQGKLSLQKAVPGYKVGEIFEFGRRCLVFRFTCLNGHESELRTESKE